MASPNPDGEGELGLPNASKQWPRSHQILQHDHLSHLLFPEGDHY